MGELGFPTPEVAVDSARSWVPKRRIGAGEDVTVLDTRMQSEYERSHLEGPTVPAIGIRYFAVFDGGPPPATPNESADRRPLCQWGRE